MLKKYGDRINQVGLRFMATHMCFDISKAREHLGYYPIHTTEEAIEETALWAANKQSIITKLLGEVQ
jgi:nucleoside-diphosphate-sugar epimerase